MSASQGLVDGRTDILMEVRDWYVKTRGSAFYQWAFLYLGWIFLYIYLLIVPVRFEFKWLAFYLAAVVIIQVSQFLLALLYSKIIKDTKKWHSFLDPDSDKSRKKIVGILPYNSLLLKLLLVIPAEDGLFLIPLFYTGINIFTASASAILFAIAHYPSYKILWCIPKGVSYFFVALFILPQSGIAPIIAGHFILDLIVGLVEKTSSWPYKLYYPDGTLREEGQTLRKLREGIIKTYYPSGKLHMEFSCRKGKTNGESKIFFENGALSVQGFNKNGLWQGLIRIYHEDGTLKEEVVYTDGKRLLKAEDNPKE